MQPVTDAILPVHFVCVALLLFGSDSNVEKARRNARVAYVAYMAAFAVTSVAWVVVKYYMMCGRSIAEFAQIKHAGMAFMLVGVCVVLLHLLLRILAVIQSSSTDTLRHIFVLDSKGKCMWLLAQFTMSVLLYCTITVLYNQKNVCLR